MRAKLTDNVVFSGQLAHPKNPRCRLTLMRGQAYLASGSGNSTLALPMAADQNFAKRMMELRFNLLATYNYYAGLGLLHYVYNDMPPEFDIVEEMEEAHTIYRHYIASLATI